MSRTNETRHISWHKTGGCKCRLDASVCTDKQCWNSNKCGCECKELICKGMCDDGCIWNPGICDCECDKSWGWRIFMQIASVEEGYLIN